MKCVPTTCIVGVRESINYTVNRFPSSGTEWIRVFSNRRRTLPVSGEYFQVVEYSAYSYSAQSFQREKN